MEAGVLVSWRLVRKEVVTLTYRISGVKSERFGVRQY